LMNRTIMDKRSVLIRKSSKDTMYYTPGGRKGETRQVERFSNDSTTSAIRIDESNDHG
jgi:hypothetical protein